ncbi:MAG: RagB/SusD family nutrient uptake outer membrane protein [Paludibacter sp.]|nr:RagB/SusD family nutrient uptake outer membrane protein [Paludibacter sp.]
MKNKIYYVILLSVVSFNGCNYLDTPYDNRTRIDSEDKIGKLLVSAYSDQSEWTLAEFSSDNADHILGSGWDVYDIIQQEAYLWQPATGIEQDTPDAVWEGCYKAIANANLALESIKELETTLGITAQLRAYRAEALIARAYNHFVLANIFCMPYGSSSGSDLGMPYMEHVENTVAPKYERGTLAQVYANIDKDIEAALPDIYDGFYAVPKYRFNRKAAYAFAARFNLYYRKYDKVIRYANEVLGSDASAACRNWSEARTLSPNGDERPNWFVGVANHATLLDQICHSLHPYNIGPYMISCKYALCGINANTESVRANTPWGVYSLHNFQSGSYSQIPKIVVNKYASYFEYTDPVAQIGFPHIIQMNFSTDETLLCRAEAEIMLGYNADAVADMNTFMLKYAHDVTAKTQDIIVNFYNSMAYYTPFAPTAKKHIKNPDLAIQEGSVQENLLQCLLHIRRILTVHEGLRWYDVKRMGIEIYRRDIQGTAIVAVTDSLKINDPRRAIQLPSSVISAGIQPNPR